MGPVMCYRLLVDGTLVGTGDVLQVTCRRNVGWDRSCVTGVRFLFCHRSRPRSYTAMTSTYEQPTAGRVGNVRM